MSQPCMNCGLPCNDRYCSNCGQKTSTKRISFHALLHDIPHSILHIDKGFFHTFLELIKRPGLMISEYVSGKRINQYKPLGYLIILSAASSLMGHYKIAFLEYFKGQQIELSPYVVSVPLALFFSKYPALMFCLMVPVMSLWSFLFNRRSGYNYAENLVLNIYLIAQFNVFIILNDIFEVVIGRSGGKVTYMLVAFFLYTAFVYTRFFQKRHVFETVLLYLALILTILTTLSVCGFMTPWWGVR